MGDVIISTSCIAPLRKHFPDAFIAFAVAEQYACLLDGNSLIDAVISLGEDDLAKQIRGFGFDVVVHLNPHAQLEWLCYSCAIEKRIGYRHRKRNPYLTHCLPYRMKKQGDLHEAEYNMQLLSVLGVRSMDRLLPHLSVAESARLWATEQSQQWGSFVLFHLSAHANKMRTPSRIFASLAQRILTETDLRLVLIGSRDTQRDVDAFYAKCASHDPRVVNLVGKTTLAELTALCTQATFLLTRDSGPAHLAAGLGCKTITLFAEPSKIMGPKRWKPLGLRSIAYTKPTRKFFWQSANTHARKSMAQFDTDEIYALLLSKVL